MANQITKNQHYIPRFLLNNFGWRANKTNRINIIDINRFTARYDQSIAKNFSQNYFYDRDNSVENCLQKYIEDPACGSIRKILDGETSISIEDRHAILIFVSVLYFRTVEATEKALSFMESFYQSIVEQIVALNGFNPDHTPRLKINLQNPSDLTSRMVFQGFIDAKILIDLDLHIIKNNSDLGFCISDHPVFLYNWFYKDLKHPAVTSLTAKGLQIFLPISPNLLILLYDSDTYKVGKKNSSITESEDINDVEILNSFQLLNSRSIIGFRNQTDEISLMKLLRKNKMNKIYEHKSATSRVEDDLTGEIKTNHLVFTDQLKIKKMPSFITIRKDARKDLSSFYERNPALSAIHQSYRNKILRAEN
ncbi:MAG: DUF4238 domain-containing protein [Thainema sp.]